MEDPPVDLAVEPVRPRWKAIVYWSGKGPRIPLWAADKVGLYGPGTTVTRHTSFMGWRSVRPNESIAMALLALFVEQAPEPWRSPETRCVTVSRGNQYWSAKAVFTLVGGAE